MLISFIGGAVLGFVIALKVNGRDALDDLFVEDGDGRTKYE